MFTRWLKSLFASEKAPSTEGMPVRVSTAAPKVKPDSTLAVVVSMSSDGAVVYIAAVEKEIQACIDACRLGEATLPLALVHEQIHRLKNSIAPMGSPELLYACEQLRLEAAGATGGKVLAARYKAIAFAALHAVGQFKTSGAGRRP